MTELELQQREAALEERLVQLRDQLLASEQQREDAQRQLYLAHRSVSELAGQLQSQQGRMDSARQRIERIETELAQLVQTLDGSREQAREARSLGADYIGVGPIFATKTKEDVVAPVGYDYLDWVSRHADLPFVAIGGIKQHNIAEVARHGARCCSLVSELVGAPDIRARVAAVRNVMREGMVG